MNQMCDTLEAFDVLPDGGEPMYRVVVRVRDTSWAAHQIRQVVARTRGDLRRLTQDTRRQSSQVSLRLGARRIDDVVTALEAAGFDIGAVVATHERAAVAGTHD